MSRPKIAIVAALPREIRPLVKGWAHWPRTRRQKDFPTADVFMTERAVAIAGGMGAGAIEAATESMIRNTTPELIISAGFAGALLPGVSTGTVVIPATVVDAANRRSFDTFAGMGVLVTAVGVASAQEKASLAARHSAQAVDMESATVAWLAREAGIKFLAIKAIFDEHDRTAPGEEFLSPHGRFRYGKFLAYTAMHPQTWPELRRMARDASVSARALGNVLNSIIACESLTEIQQQIAQRVLSTGQPD